MSSEEDILILEIGSFVYLTLKDLLFMINKTFSRRKTGCIWLHVHWVSIMSAVKWFGKHDV